jgi:hypothetical protein
MRKHAGFQATQNRRKKTFAFFLGSARVGIVQIAALAVSVLEGPPPRGFSAFYVMDSSFLGVTGESRVRNRTPR